MYARNAYLARSLPTRIDLVLEVFNLLMGKLRHAQALIESDPAEARRLMHPCRLAVAAMAAGQDLALGELAVNFARLYEFVAHALARNDAQGIQDAIDVLQTLQSGFAEARTEAVHLERAGHIPPLDQGRLQITA